MEGIQGYLTLGKNWSDKKRRGRIIKGKGLSCKVPVAWSKCQMEAKAFDLGHDDYALTQSTSCEPISCAGS
jgi:hypothetical protein